MTLLGMQPIRIFMKSPVMQTDIFTQLTEYLFQKHNDYYFSETLTPPRTRQSAHLILRQTICKTEAVSLHHP